VFVTGAAVLHLIRPSRGRCVPREVFGQGWQGVWVSGQTPAPPPDSRPQAPVCLRDRSGCAARQQHLRAAFAAERDIRKVTNGFRAEWGSETYAAFRTVASTARQTGKTVRQAIADSLAPKAIPNPG